MLCSNAYTLLPLFNICNEDETMTDVIDLGTTRSEHPEALSRADASIGAALRERFRREEKADKWLGEMDRLHFEMGVAAETFETIQNLFEDYHVAADDCFRKLGVPVSQRPHYPFSAMVLLQRELTRLGREAERLFDALEDCPEAVTDQVRLSSAGGQ